ncbi:peptidase associated/transthyretin-like domain-containing protein [Nafulsella turpanensis]|uniref:hypothetical protein n=1 Tax=Nafulsella turpanensis TaxID=1265690 RepID=UPI0003466F04|nr:hypothetical protein [Nafulsella turpanensis]
MKSSVFVLFILLFTQVCQAQKEKVQYQSLGRCDGCEAIFEYGNRKLSSIDTLPDYHQNEPKLKLSGTIYKPDGRTPAPGVVLFVYQTDSEGKYPKKGNEVGWAKRQGYIRAWMKTDQNGAYTFYTFMPGSYGNGPAHIHATVLEPDGKYYFIDDFTFEGDPNMDSSLGSKNRGGSGLVKLQKEGVLLSAERDIVLGLNIPDYE